MSRMVCILVGFLFVGKMNLVVVGEKDEVAREVYSKLQQQITFWNVVLGISGGNLKLEKCYWYFTGFLCSDSK